MAGTNKTQFGLCARMLVFAIGLTSFYSNESLAQTNIKDVMACYRAIWASTLDDDQPVFDYNVNDRDDLVLYSSGGYYIYHGNKAYFMPSQPLTDPNHALQIRLPDDKNLYLTYKKESESFEGEEGGATHFSSTPPKGSVFQSIKPSEATGDESKNVLKKEIINRIQSMASVYVVKLTLLKVEQKKQNMSKPPQTSVNVRTPQQILNELLSALTSQCSGINDPAIKSAVAGTKKQLQDAYQVATQQRKPAETKPAAYIRQ